MVIRSRAYLMASSMARLATPTAPEATGGRVLSKAPMATLKPAPSAPSTLDEGTTTLSKKSGRVSEQRCPMFTNFSPTEMPGLRKTWKLAVKQSCTGSPPPHARFILKKI